MPPLLTPTLLQKLREIVERHHTAFLVNAFGKTTVAPDVLARLETLGLIGKNPGTALADAYLYGQVLAATNQQEMLGWSEEKFQKWLERNPIPLSEAEEAAIHAANNRAAVYCAGLGNVVEKTTGQLLVEADAALRAKLEGDIQGATAANIAKRATVRELKTALGHATEDWTRDLDRIAITEKHNALTEGTADAIAKMDGADAEGYFQVFPGACDSCIRLHIGPDGHPRFFKIANLPGPGANVKRPQREWVANLGSVHPHCACKFLRRPPGWGFNEAGQLVPGGEFGTDAPDDLERSLAQMDEHRDRLEKAYGKGPVPPAEMAAFMASDADLEEWEGCCRAVLKEVSQEPGVPFHKLTDRVSLNYGEDLGGRVAIALAASGAIQKRGEKFYPTLEKARRLAGRMDFQGLKISLEHLPGDQRHWYDPHAKEAGTTTMKVPYGYIRMTEGVDGDHHDVFMGPDPTAQFAYVVHARKKVGVGKFGGLDEQKTMLGFPSAAAARAAYVAHYNDPGFYGGMDAIPMADFKRQVLEVRHGKTVRGLPVHFKEHADERIMIKAERPVPFPGSGGPIPTWEGAHAVVGDPSTVSSGTGGINLQAGSVPRPIPDNDPAGMKAWLMSAAPRTVVIKRSPKTYQYNQAQRLTVPVDLENGVMATAHDLPEPAAENKQNVERLLLRDALSPRNEANPGWKPEPLPLHGPAGGTGEGERQEDAPKPKKPKRVKPPRTPARAGELAAPPDGVAGPGRDYPAPQEDLEKRRPEEAAS